MERPVGPVGERPVWAVINEPSGSELPKSGPAPDLEVEHFEDSTQNNACNNYLPKQHSPPVRECNLWYSDSVAYELKVNVTAI